MGSEAVKELAESTSFPAPEEAKRSPEDWARVATSRVQQDYEALVRAIQDLDARSDFVDVIATGSLPAAGASQNGRIVIEDAGAGDRNLIIYAGGQRFRIDGGAAF